LALMASVTVSGVAQASGFDYWSQVVKPSGAATYFPLDDQASWVAPDHNCGTATATDGTAGLKNLANGHFDGIVSGCDQGVAAPTTDVAPGAGLSSALGLVAGGAAGGMWVNLKLQDPLTCSGCTGTATGYATQMWSRCGLTGGSDQFEVLMSVGKLGSAGYWDVRTSDQCAHLSVAAKQNDGTLVTHEVVGPGRGKWFQDLLVWQADGTLTWFGGQQGTGAVVHTIPSVVLPSDYSNSSGVYMQDNGQGIEVQGAVGENAQFAMAASWMNGAAVALLSCPDGNTGNCATWAQLLNDFVPYGGNGPGGGGQSCTVDGATGVVTCTSGGGGVAGCTGTPAPLTHSRCKPTIAPIELPVCIAPSSWNPVDWVPYLGCLITYAIDWALNVGIGLWNLLIDIIVPDGSGLDGWQAVQADMWTRFPLGFYTSAHNELAGALGAPSYGSYSCTGDVNHFPTSCGFSGGAGSFTYTIGSASHVVDIPANMYPLTHAYVPMMSAMVFLFFGIGLIRASRADVAGKPE
jgi:hypothetical protein